MLIRAEARSMILDPWSSLFDPLGPDVPASRSQLPPASNNQIRNSITVQNGLNEPVFEKSIFFGFLVPGVVSNRFALKFHHYGLFFHDFSMNLMTIVIFDPRNYYIRVVYFPCQRELLYTSGSQSLSFGSEIIFFEV